MVTVLRYMAGYWLGISSLILVLYDWQIRHRLPKGIETLELIILIPGVLFLLASFVISFRTRRREAIALKKMFPNGLPEALSNPTPASPRYALVEENRSTLKAKPSSGPPGHVAQTTTFAMEQARDRLVSSVLNNSDALRNVVLFLAQKDVSAADALSEIVHASEAVRRFGADEPS